MQFDGDHRYIYVFYISMTATHRDYTVSTTVKSNRMPHGSRRRALACNTTVRPRCSSIKYATHTADTDDELTTLFVSRQTHLGPFTHSSRDVIHTDELETESDDAYVIPVREIFAVEVCRHGNV
jgi:hypothetical protein